MREHKEIIHNETERAEMLQILYGYQKETAILLRDYLVKEKPLRNKNNYMTLRKPILDAYRAADKGSYDAYVVKARERKYDAGSE